MINSTKRSALAAMRMTNLPRFPGMIVGVAPALVSKWVLRDWSAPLARPRRRPTYRENAAPVAPFLQFAGSEITARPTYYGGSIARATVSNFAADLRPGSFS